MRLLLLTTLIPALAAALGEQSCLSFTASSDSSTLFDKASNYALPLLTASSDPACVHIAATTFARDVEWVTGVNPGVYNDTLPSWATRAILVGTADSDVTTGEGVEMVKGKWEAWDARIVKNPRAGVEEALVIVGSDKRGAVYGLYTLSEQMGVSPFHFWADVPVHSHSTVTFSRSERCGHGSPHVKYRGFFINDEAPVLVNWIKDHWKLAEDTPQFQTWLYEPLFELLLRMKGNYFWPAMWAEMFDVDGLDVSDGLPKTPIPGPNQVLADRMGIVMGTSHQEPMARNTPEWENFGQGDWNFTSNSEFLDAFWRYGAERAKGLDTLFTVGMRGNGDIPLPGANIPIMENITAAQQQILREVFGSQELKVPQVWAMYKEVMGYFANGMTVPQDVTPLLAEDNWGNLVAVLPWGSNHSSGGGIYYHADYVGDPRNYKWLNTVPLAKMWEQLHIASAFNTDEIWILNVGDMKMLEVPLEWFMSLAYDSERWPRNSLKEWFTTWAKRNFQMNDDDAKEVASIMLRYQMTVSRRKPELLDSGTFSLVNYNEADTVMKDWKDLEYRSKCLKEKLDHANGIAFYELVHAPIALNANLNELYVSSGKSNLYAGQSKQSASRFAEKAMKCFEEDQNITNEFHSMLDGKWNYMLAQPHINYQYWQSPMSNTLPQISFASPWTPSFPNGITYTRVTVENLKGAWPGDNRFNCAKGYNCGDPLLLTMTPYGKDRWAEVGSGGPMDINFTATTNVSWVKVEPEQGHVKGDGTSDTRCDISVDWDSVPANFSGAAGIWFNSSDGTSVPVTIPIRNHARPSGNYTGFVEGDGYVVMEAAHYQQYTTAGQNGTTYAWEEVEDYGRTLSGMSLFPVGPQNFTAGTGPILGYDFFTCTAHTTPANVTIQIGPSLNFILGEFLSFSVSMDGSAPKQINPIPAAPLGSQPSDWLNVVANEIRNVTLPMDITGAGNHRLELGGMTPGVVVERIWVDMGGIAERGYSYLGPPESARLENGRVM